LPQKKKKFSLSVEPSFSLPNGSLLNQPIDPAPISENNTNNSSWIHTLSLKLSELLINSPASISSSSSSSVQTLIESSLLSLLAIPNFTLSF